jgi:V8-like Glu-specific endopeptidase
MIFSILHLDSDNILKHKGTGFVVNSKGLFLTAGHVINKYIDEIDKLYAAFPDKEESSKLFNIQKLHHEYFYPLDATSPNDLKRKKLPKYEDLFIGRLLGYKEKEHFKFRIKRPLQDEIITSKGYITGQQKELPIVEDKVDLKSLNLITQPSPIKYRDFSIVSKKDRDYEIDSLSVEAIKKYNNCLMLRYPIRPGSSGGPVIDANNNVIGIILGGVASWHCFNVLCSRYIKKQYRHIR